MKKIIIFFAIFLVLIATFFIVRNASINNKLNNALAFKNADVKNIWVLESNHGLSYDYKVDTDVAEQISSQLIKSKKKVEKKALILPKYDGFIFYIFFKDDNNAIYREIDILPNNDNSVYVVVKTQNSNAGSGIESFYLSAESLWLSQYLDKVKKGFE